MTLSQDRYKEFTPSPKLKKKYLIIFAVIIYSIFLFFSVPFLIIVLVDLVNNGIGESLNFLPVIGFFFLGITLIYILGSIFIIYYYRTISYTINTREIHVFRGLITKSHKIVPFRTITNIDLKRGLFDRIIGIGTIEIQTAGSSAPKMGPEERIDGINLIEIEPLRELILNQVRGLIGGSAGVTQDLETVSDVSTLVDILDELRKLRSDLASR